MKLYEAYKNRLAVADQAFAKAHEGGHMDSNRKLVTAKVLELFEALDRNI